MKSLFVTTFGLLVLSGLTQCATTKLGENEKKIYVASSQVDCTGVAPMKCLQIKEDVNDKWQYFYQSIAGFTYQPGYEYELIVKTESIAHPPADGSSIKYTLIKQVSKIKK